MADIETLGARVVYENRWMRVREDAIRRRDGSAGIYGTVEKRDFVVIAPLEDDRIHSCSSTDILSRADIGGSHRALDRTHREPSRTTLRAVRYEEETGLCE